MSCTLIYRDNDIVSQSMMIKILFVVNIISKIQADVNEQGTFKLPKLNVLMNYHRVKRNRIPVFPSTEVDVPESFPTPLPAYTNLLSVHLRFMMSSTLKARKITSLHDRTLDQPACFHQGEKGRSFPTVERNLNRQLDFLASLPGS